MKALDILQKARESAHLYQDGTSICIYGPPKTGKTIFAATAAKAPHVERVILYDFEHSSPSIFGATYADGSPILTMDDLAKIEIVNIPDTRDLPIAAETALKIVTTKYPFTIDKAGKLGKAKGNEDFIFDPAERSPNIVEIFDSGSQIADSIFNDCKNKYDFKDLRQYYGEASYLIDAFLISVQQCKGIRVVVTHVSITDEGTAENPKEFSFPYMGSKKKSEKSGKYFDTIIYKELQLKKFANISTPTSRTRILAGSRYHVNLEKLDNPTLADVLVWKEDKDAKLNLVKQKLNPK